MSNLTSAPLISKNRTIFVGLFTLLAACGLFLWLILQYQQQHQTPSAQEQLETQVDQVYHEGMVVAEGKITAIDPSTSSMTIQSSGEDGSVNTSTISTKNSELVVFGKSYNNDKTTVSTASLDQLKINDQLVIYANKPAKTDSAIEATAIRVLIHPGDTNDMPVKSGPSKGVNK